MNWLLGRDLRLNNRGLLDHGGLLNDGSLLDNLGLKNLSRLRHGLKGHRLASGYRLLDWRNRLSRHRIGRNIGMLHGIGLSGRPGLIVIAHKRDYPVSQFRSPAALIVCADAKP